MKGLITMKKEVPIYQKQNLTIEEAAAYSSIGENRITALLKEPDCNFVLYVGNKRLVKRQLFDKFIESAKYL